ncbi:MAG: class I SAM-dependent methyltransferase [Candidatus Aminicenantes bacterium]
MNLKNTLKVIGVVSILIFFSQTCREKSSSYDESELDVPYVPTPMQVVDEMFRLAELKKGDVLLDLGCGDGRIPITAALQYGIKGYGVDLNPERIRESRENAKEAGVEDLVEFHEQDLHETDLTKASVITLYLLPSVNLKLRSRILNEAKPGTRVVSHDFNMSEWSSDKDSMIFADEEAHVVYYWMVPANLTGEWDLKLEDSSLDVKIIFNQVFQFAQGKVIPEKEEWKITEENIKGDKISFTLLTPSSGWNFTGSVKGDVMSGYVEKGTSGKITLWEAVRDPDTKQPLDIISSS